MGRWSTRDLYGGEIKKVFESLAIAPEQCPGHHRESQTYLGADVCIIYTHICEYDSRQKHILNDRLDQETGL